MSIPWSSRLLWALAWLAGSPPRALRGELAEWIAQRHLGRNSKRARIVRCNLALIGEQASVSPAAVLRHTVLTLLESLRYWTRPPKQNLGDVVEVIGQAHFDAARARGGVLVIAPHQGNWELLVQWMAARAPFSLLYSRTGNAAMDGFLQLARQRSGVRTVAADAHGMKPLLRALQRGEVVGITPDQRPDPSGGLWSTAFGQPAFTMHLIPRLLQRTGATPLLVAAERRDDGRFRLVIAPADLAVASGDAQTAVDAMNADVDALVRRDIAQYQWTYKRFKGRLPDGRKLNPYWPDCYR